VNLGVLPTVMTEITNGLNSSFHTDAETEGPARDEARTISFKIVTNQIIMHNHIPILVNNT
jgi:hypothetical protein